MGLSFIGTISWARPTCDEKEAASKYRLYVVVKSNRYTSVWVGVNPFNPKFWFCGGFTNSIFSTALNVIAFVSIVLPLPIQPNSKKKKKKNPPYNFLMRFGAFDCFDWRVYHAS